MLCDLCGEAIIGKPVTVKLTKAGVSKSNPRCKRCYEEQVSRELRAMNAIPDKTLDIRMYASPLMHDIKYHGDNRE